MRPKRAGHSINWPPKSAIAALILASASLAGAQGNPPTLCFFNGTNGVLPSALTFGNDGNLYGTTEYGGEAFGVYESGYGTVFKLTTNGTLTTLVAFNYTNGAYPYALTLGNDGNFYGTARYGGSGSYGMVFRVTKNGTLTTLVAFNGANGEHPNAPTLGNDGNLYGTTEYGGDSNEGTVFRVTTNGTLTTLASFSGTNGAYPWAAPTPGTDGNFYGTTSGGGISNCGTVFKLTTNGTLTTLVAFNYTNGACPYALTLGNDGNFYGTTYGGGISNYGTVFKITTSGALTKLVAFNGANGKHPNAPTLGNDGNLYGTTEYGGIDGVGTVFRVTTNGRLTTLAYFSEYGGRYPVAALTLGNDGNLYGASGGGITYYQGFPQGMGTVFCLLRGPVPTTQPQSQTIQTLFSFNSPSSGNPQATLTLGNDGNFYGTTSYGTSYGGSSYRDGTVFQVTTNGTLTTLVSFNGANGASPNALTLGGDGNLYGTTMYSGTGAGTVFKMTPNGTLTKLAYFSDYYGGYPNALTLGNDGSFYGTTRDGGASGDGTVFKVTTNGMLTRLVSFSGANGAYPEAALTLGNDGNFYGTTSYGGITNSTWPYGMGTLFKVTTNGTLTRLVSFNSTNGAYPVAALTLGNDGNFYGTTKGGGITNLTFTDGMGTVFKVTTNGTMTTLVAFDYANGAYPVAALTLGKDGNFYGTTYYGASGGCGTVFQVMTNGALTTLYSFTGGNDGASPYAGLTLGNDGNFYGTTEVGGSRRYGTVFRMSLSPAIILQPQSQTNNAGATVTFLVSATSLAPVGYQWQQNGTNLVEGGNVSGATANTLSIMGVSDSDAGIYSVLLTNSYGSVTSSNATLTVIDPPSITVQPVGQRVLMGSSVSFSVSVTGTLPFSYQWRFNGNNLLNATNALYAIQAVGATNTGNYSVVVTNMAGSVTSSNALLTVLVPPTLGLQFSAGYPLLDLNGMLSNNFVVQYITNLAGTNWLNLLSLTNLPSSPYLFLDSGGVGQPARFYRAFMQ